VHNKILINAGFYLLLLFAFTVTIAPVVSYFIALSVFLIWFMDLLIFKEPEFTKLALFYPILCFNIFLILAWVAHRIYGLNFELVYIGFLSLFYFVIPGFIITAEQRRMLLWTFIAGAILSSAIYLIGWWGVSSGTSMKLRPISPVQIAQITLAICILVSIYSEAPRIKDKVFSGMVILPALTTILLSADKPAAYIFVLIVLIAAILSDRTILIPLGLASAIFFTGAMGFSYFIEKNIKLSQYTAYVSKPVFEFRESRASLTNIGFYGANLATFSKRTGRQNDWPYYFEIVYKAGPPFLIIFFWIVYVRTQEAFLKRRKIISHQGRAYHLTVIMIFCAVVVLGLYNRVLFQPSIILSIWLILGMSEV
jgi:hypothetical protein